MILCMTTNKECRRPWPRLVDEMIELYARLRRKDSRQKRGWRSKRPRESVSSNFEALRWWLTLALNALFFYRSTHSKKRHSQASHYVPRESLCTLLLSVLSSHSNFLFSFFLNKLDATENFDTFEVSIFHKFSVREKDIDIFLSTQ